MRNTIVILLFVFCVISSFAQKYVSHIPYLPGEYLIAPMIDPGESRDVKLPSGIWIDDRGEKYVGGQTIQVDIPLNRLCYFILQE